MTARITDLHPGLDGMVRLANIQTGKGIYKRCVCKICRLPIQNYTEAVKKKRHDSFHGTVSKDVLILDWGASCTCDSSHHGMSDR